MVPGLFTSVVIVLNWLRGNNIAIDCKNDDLVQIRMDEELTNRKQSLLLKWVTDKMEEAMSINVSYGGNQSYLLQILKEHQKK